MFWAMLEQSSSDGQSVEVPSKDPNEVMPWDEPEWRTGWRAFFDEERRIDGGRGGFGIVLQVVERATGQRFALKHLQSNDAESRARFKREIEQQKRLKHPHVIAVCRHGDDFDWYTMPIANGSLAEFAPELSDDEIADVIDHAARALDAAHKLGIVHRDIKPANILLERALPGDPRAWMVSDFGLARASRGDSGNLKTTAAAGTPGYIAPELFINPHENATPVSDVFSLGRTLAFLTTGHHPKGLEPSPSHGVWSKLVEQMTELQVDRRMQTMEDVIKGVFDVKRALCAERKARWGKPQVVIGSMTVGWREDRVIWTIVNQARGEHLELRIVDIDADMTQGEVRLTLSRLETLAFVTRHFFEPDEFNSGGVVYRLTDEAVQYAARNIDRLTAAYRGDGNDRPAEFEHVVRGRDRT
jgi:serine/threonine protein kinase